MFRAGFRPEGMMSTVIRHAEGKEKKVRENALHQVSSAEMSSGCSEY